MLSKYLANWHLFKWLRRHPVQIVLCHHWSFQVIGEPQTFQKRICVKICKVCSIEGWFFKKFCFSKQNTEETNRSAILHNLKLALKMQLCLWQHRFCSSPCLQKHHQKNKVPVSIFAILTVGRFFAEHDRSGFFLIHICPLFQFQKVFFFFFFDGAHRWPCSQIWKGFFGNQIQHCGWNLNCFKAKAIRWPTQTDPRAGLKMSWLRVFCYSRTLRTFSCDFFMCLWMMRQWWDRTVGTTEALVIWIMDSSWTACLDRI